MPRGDVLRASSRRASPARCRRGPALSLFTERDDASGSASTRRRARCCVSTRFSSSVTASLQARPRRVLHFQALVAERDRQIAPVARERERSARRRWPRSGSRFSALEDERLRLERAIAAQERIIAYRQSARWWVRCRGCACKLLWQRISGRMNSSVDDSFIDIVVPVYNAPDDVRRCVESVLAHDQRRLPAHADRRRVARPRDRASISPSFAHARFRRSSCCATSAISASPARPTAA